MDFKPKLFILSSGVARLKYLAHFLPEFDLQFLSFFQRKSARSIRALINLQHSKSSDFQGVDAPQSFRTTVVTAGILPAALEVSDSLNPLPTNTLSFDESAFWIGAWGKKPSARKAENLANAFSLPLVRLEDGFLRSVAPNTLEPLSLILDRYGIYYDANTPSDLEAQIAQTLSTDQIARAQAIQWQWCQAGVSKYNHSPNILQEQLDALTDGKPYLLLVDQTVGDASVTYGQASVHSFEQMLSNALQHPDRPLVLVKLHPEVVSGKKRGYLSELIEQTRFAQFPQIRVIDWDVHLPSLFTQALALYTVTSQSGFEGLLHGIPVYTFGMPFYAGWGLTQDALSAPSRRNNATLEQLVHGALVTYPRYIDPHTGELTDIESTIAYLHLQREQLFRFKEYVSAQGFSAHKLRHLKRFTQGAQWANRQIENSHQPIVFRWGAQATHQDALQLADSKPEVARAQSISYIQVEDGFIRSLGLGAMLRTPYSWVFDHTGMYYDATRPSDLEMFLQNHEFTNVEITRASNLQQLLIHLEITKYNLDTSAAIAHPATDFFIREIQSAKEAKRPIALIIGQVETDASIDLGGIDIKTNWELVQAVREQFPSAYLIYKPHPDVQAGLRRGNQDHEQIRSVCDFFATEHSLPELLQHVDALHTISSLSGFEALLRNTPVYCYGLPFYAGWGLTIDRHRCERRNRKLTLPQLIYGALIYYPTYVHPITGAYCTPEDLCIAFEQERAKLKDLLAVNTRFSRVIGQRIIWRGMQIYHWLRRI